MGNGPDSEDRRSFLRIAVFGGLAVIAGGVGAASVFAPPSAGEAVGDGPRPLVPMIKLGALTAGKPLALKLTLSLRDAWRVRSRTQTVFILRIADEDSAEAFTALSSVCPHSGCSIEHKEDKFHCPCHGAEFELDGSYIKGPAPRDMDPLAVSIAEHEGAPWLFVDWQEFVLGSEARTPRGSV